MAGEQALTTSITNVTHDDIFVRGHRLADLVGKMSFSDAFFLQMRGRMPNERESKMLAALLINSMDHGITQTVQVARMTFSQAPESINAAIAAAVLGLGSKADGAIELTADLLQRTAADADARKVSDEQAVADAVARYRAAGTFLPGLGHARHKSGDPRTTRMFQLAEELGFNGRYFKMMGLFAKRAAEVTGRDLPINGAAAVATIYCELGFPPPIARAITMVALTAGITGHLLEEIEKPMGRNMRTLISKAVKFEDGGAGH